MKPDTDAETLTMADHLAIHADDGLCPECNGEDWIGGAACHRCCGDRRRGEDCPTCKGVGGGYTGESQGNARKWERDWRACPAPDCRYGRRVNHHPSPAFIADLDTAAGCLLFVAVIGAIELALYAFFRVE